jgi:hypothetical protein
MQVVICCPTPKGMTQKDKKEIENLLNFKKRYKESKKNERIF